MKVNQKELESVLKLDAPKRYNYFIKKVVDFEICYALFKDGWIIVATSDNQIAFPLWPLQEYAEICKSGEWENAEIVAIPLDELINQLLPSLEKDNISTAIFYTPENKGVVVSCIQLKNDLREEIKKYL
jgi:hypothetical protein